MMSAIVDEFFDKQNMWVGLNLGLEENGGSTPSISTCLWSTKNFSMNLRILEKYQKAQRPPMIIPITEEKILQISR